MIAYLVLSHVNAPQIVRLVTKLAAQKDVIVFLHHDGRNHPLPMEPFAELDNVRIVPSSNPVHWGTFGQVDAVLSGIEMASAVPYDWMVLVSGQDYPCVALPDFHRALAASGVDGFMNYMAADAGRQTENADRYFFRYVSVPERWRALNARLWRLNRLQPFVRFHSGRVGSFVGIADRTPFLSRPCFRGAFWWALSRRCTDEVARVARTEPSFVRAYRQRLHPDESFVQTILMSNKAFVIASDDLRYQRFDTTDSPTVLGAADLAEIHTSRRPFARKFDTRVDSAILDRLDADVAAGSAPAPALGGALLPRLTIGMPVYNGQTHIAAAIGSILTQTYADFELIVSDDASTDATADIVAELAASDPRIRFVRNAHNMGASYNSNRTFALARGTYFRLAAPDDILAPQCLERCIEILERDSTVSLAYAQASPLDEQEPAEAEFQNRAPFEADDPCERFAKHLQLSFDGARPIFGIARNDVLARTPMIANYAGSEAILLGELALHGKMHEVPEKLVSIRSRVPTSTTEKYGRMSRYAPHLRCYYEYRTAIRRAPLSSDQRRRCNRILTHWAIERRGLFWQEAFAVGARLCGLRRWGVSDSRGFATPAASDAGA